MILLGLREHVAQIKLYPKAFRVRLCGLEYLPDFVYMLSKITKE